MAESWDPLTRNEVITGSRKEVVNLDEISIIQQEVIIRDFS